mgnify:CR=1 FL=1
MGSIWILRDGYWRAYWLRIFTMVIETIIWHCKKCNWDDEKMSWVAGIPNFVLGLLGVGLTLYFTQDKWRGKIGL